VERAHSHRTGSSPVRTHHIGIISSHAKQIEDRKRLPGKAPSPLVHRCSDARSPECASSTIEPSVATREGKRSHQTAENEKRHSAELCESA